MITLENDRLVFRFPEVHEDAAFSIDFQRTLRIPDDGADYPLPPGLGRFPLRHLDDFADRLPADLRRRGGIILPMHQAEALWINFSGGWWSGFGTRYPFAVKIATGKRSAISGEDWVDQLNRDPQDYVVVPDQPWLDGYCVEKGVIRQFVAMPLGRGYTAEEQLSGLARHGGLQIAAYPMKAKRYEALRSVRAKAAYHDLVLPLMSLDAFGLAPGGRMRQKIYDDPHPLDAWDQRHVARCFVTIVNAAQWVAITGEAPPTEPPTAAQYTRAGLPWFSYYDDDAEAIAGAATLAGMKSVTEMGETKGEKPLPENESVEVAHTVGIRARRSAQQVREAPTF